MAGVDATGARAVEVAAMMGDTVVHVAHLTDPKGGKVTPLTYGLFISGVAAILIAAFSFQHGVHVARVNKANLAHWVDVDKLAPAEFRPIRLAPMWDAMAFLGLGFGLAAVTWGAARRLDERRSSRYRIGRDERLELAVDTDTHTLVGPQGDDFAFHWIDGMTGEMSVDGAVTPLDKLPRTMTIPAGARIHVALGPTKLIVSSVPAPRRQGAGLYANLEGAVLACVGGSTVVHLAIWLLLLAIPPESKAIAFDSLSSDLRGNRVQVKPPEDPQPDEEDTKTTADPGGAGAKQADAEGKMGTEKSTRPSGIFQMKKTDDTQHLSKAQAREQAQHSGVLGVMNRQQGGLFASVTGTGDFSSGYDDRDVAGGVIGNEPGEMAGGYGFGANGMGPGGGGTSPGTIGKGGYGTIGAGDGTGSSYGTGPGKGGLPRRRPLVPQIKIGAISSTGDLDEEIIRKYIRAKYAQFEYCYQKQLTVSPDLAGTVRTQFKIDPNGTVISATASGMGNAEVEQCVTQVILSIHFPKPTGGGFVTVSYPFTFRTAG